MKGTDIGDVFEHAWSEDQYRGTEDWVPVLTIDGGGGYDWTTLHAWYSPSANRYYWGGSSGCSCNWYGQDFNSVSDFQTGDRPALMAGIRSFMSDHEYTFRATDVVHAIMAANVFNPKEHQ